MSARTYRRLINVELVCWLVMWTIGVFAAPSVFRAGPAQEASKVSIIDAVQVTR